MKILDDVERTVLRLIRERYEANDENLRHRLNMTLAITPEVSHYAPDQFEKTNYSTSIEDLRWYEQLYATRLAETDARRKAFFESNMAKLQSPDEDMTLTLAAIIFSTTVYGNLLAEAREAIAIREDALAWAEALSNDNPDSYYHHREFARLGLLDMKSVAYGYTPGSQREWFPKVATLTVCEEVKKWTKEFERLEQTHGRDYTPENRELYARQRGAYIFRFRQYQLMLREAAEYLADLA